MQVTIQCTLPGFMVELVGWFGVGGGGGRGWVEEVEGGWGRRGERQGGGVEEGGWRGRRGLGRRGERQGRGVEKASWIGGGGWVEGWKEW